MKIKTITPVTIYKIETDSGSYIRVSDTEYYEINQDSDGQVYFHELYDFPELEKLLPDAINDDSVPESDKQISTQNLPLYI